MAASTLWPTAALQTVAITRPTPVAAAMIGIDAAIAVAGT